MTAYDDWPAFADWAAGVTEPTAPLDEAGSAAPFRGRGRCSPSG